MTELPRSLAQRVYDVVPYAGPAMTDAEIADLVHLPVETVTAELRSLAADRWIARSAKGLNWKENWDRHL